MTRFERAMARHEYLESLYAAADAAEREWEEAHEFAESLRTLAVSRWEEYRSAKRSAFAAEVAGGTDDEEEESI